MPGAIMQTAETDRQARLSRHGTERSFYGVFMSTSA